MNYITILTLFFALLSCQEKQKKELQHVETIPTNDILASSEEETQELKFTEEDLKYSTLWDLKTMRNEVFARKGYLFKDEQLNNYFSKQKWYDPIVDVKIELTAYEKKEVAFIKKLEDEKRSCITQVIDKLKLNVKNNSLILPEEQKQFTSVIYSFIENIELQTILNSEEQSVSQKLFIRDEVAGTTDPCQDQIYLYFAHPTTSFSIHVNECTEYVFNESEKEYGESSTIFEYEILDDCSYEFGKMNFAG